MPITIDALLEKNNGACFYSADLHVHSFGGSADVNDSTMTAEAIVDAAVRKGVSILAITDHNSTKNVESSIEYGRRHAGRLLVLAGVEITTAQGHLLAYFAPECAERARDLLARVAIVEEYGSPNSRSPKSMSDVLAEIERLGGVAIAAHADRDKTGFEYVISGYPNSKKDLICHSGLYGIEVHEKNHLSWYTDHDDGSTQGIERKKLLNARSLSSATAGRKNLAVIQSSDSHTLAGFESSSIATRFKMHDLSFEAFKTALIDPEARVRSRAIIPTSFPRILGMHIDGGFLDGQTYHFSDNLTCFLGGRGAGKSTAIRSLAYALGIDDEIEHFNNCPDNVVVYCEDADGNQFRFQRTRGAEAQAFARRDKTIEPIPLDTFRVDYYGQGDLAEVAHDPLSNPELFQQFLDRHIELRGLQERGTSLLEQLSQNSVQLIPLEVSAAQLPAKQKALEGVEAKLGLAEQGKVKEIAALQIRIASERSIAAAYRDISKKYEIGVSLAQYRRVVDPPKSSELTGAEECKTHLANVGMLVQGVNEYLASEQISINKMFAEAHRSLEKELNHWNDSLAKLAETIQDRISDLQKKGLKGNIQELTVLIGEKSRIAGEIRQIRSQVNNLNELRSSRATLMLALDQVRDDITERRKKQLTSINRDLSRTLTDYRVFIHYEPEGVISDFKKFVLDKMQGTYFPEENAEVLCKATSPRTLAELVSSLSIEGLQALPGVGATWAPKVQERFGQLSTLHALETLWKPLFPAIKVSLKEPGAKPIPVNQLSDGQRHTILLTIAMLAESSLPLIIDQPEDDLDNAFIFGSIVSTLRAIKERRQVICVTHNANIAVLGDSELLIPMRLSGSAGASFSEGSVDRSETKAVVQEILEGGALAFKRRKEIYGH